MIPKAAEPARADQAAQPRYTKEPLAQARGPRRIEGARKSADATPCLRKGLYEIPRLREGLSLVKNDPRIIPEG